MWVQAPQGKFAIVIAQVIYDCNGSHVPSQIVVKKPFLPFFFLLMRKISEARYIGRCCGWNYDLKGEARASKFSQRV